VAGQKCPGWQTRTNPGAGFGPTRSNPRYAMSTAGIRHRSSRASRAAPAYRQAPSLKDPGRILDASTHC
jgi:hypothetical protein